MTRIAIVTGANQDHGFALAEDLVSGRAAVPRAPRVAPERRPDPGAGCPRLRWLPAAASRTTLSGPTTEKLTYER
jgi:NAD(P)-dependent dehydrogenase (short-subunit alcohol dehydrogenase family)